MADVITKPVLSLCATVSARLPDLVIKDGQLIFVRDKHKLAFDYGGKRTFYNQIEELATDSERTDMQDPVAGLFYFVIETAVLWTYQDKWVPLTTPPKEILFIGTELPELGVSKTLYVDTENKEISVWNEESSRYVVVADKGYTFTAEEIDELFRK